MPSNGRLVLQQPGQPERRIGVDVGENPVSESLPFGHRRCDHAGGAALGDAHPADPGDRWWWCCWCWCRWRRARSSPPSPRGGWPSRSPAWPTGRPGSARATSAPPRAGTASPSSTGSPTCSTPPPPPSPSWSSASASWWATSPTSCAAGSPPCSCGSTSSPPTPIPTPAARRWPRWSRPRSSPRCSTTSWRPHRAARAAGAELMDLREGLAPVVEEWRPTLRAAGRSLKVRLPDGLLARVTPARIREAVGALVDNALRHGEGAVTLTARTVEGSLVIEVADSGRRGAGGPGAARLRPRRVRRFVHRAWGWRWPVPSSRPTAGGWSSPACGPRCSRSSCPRRGPTT